MQNSIINTHIYTYTCIPYHLPKLKNYSLTFLENADANTIIYSIIDDNIKISAIFEHLQDQRNYESPVVGPANSEIHRKDRQKTRDDRHNTLGEKTIG